jgi:hypothetical protein
MQKGRDLANSREHEILTKSVDSVAAAMGDMADKLMTMTKCITELKHGRTCDDT